MQEHLKDEKITLKQSVELTDEAPPTETEQFPAVDSNYKIVRLIGHGGMGTVYKATNVNTGSTVAIKIFNSTVSKDKATLKRFEQEISALANLDDPDLLTIYDSGKTPDGAPYLVMEYIEGNNLAEILTREKIENARALSLFTKLCDLISRAHRRGIIHRDIKPSNVIVSKTNVEPKDENGSGEADYERVRVVDFGIARILDSVKGDTTKLTQTGAVFGTPTYMSPEQCQAKQAVDQRSDIYSLGCVMYEVLTGQPPFAGDNPIQVAMQHVNDAPKPLTSKGCSKDLARVVLQCLAKDPKDRYQSVDDLCEDLVLVKQNHHPKHLKTPRVSKKRPTLSIGISFVLLLTMIIAFNNNVPVRQSLDLSNPPSATSTLQSRTAKAEREVRQLTAEIKLHPNDKFWYLKRAQAYSDLGRHNEAIADDTTAIKLDPNDVHAYTNRGSDYTALERYDLSMKDDDKALSLSPNHVNAICNRAINFMEMKDYKSALAECEKAIRLDPERIDAYLTRGRVYMRTKQYDKALKEFDTAVRVDPRSTFGYWNRSQCHSEMSHLTRSITDASTAIALDPTDPFLYTNRASIYLEQKQEEAAFDDIESALKIDPDNAQALEARGDYYVAKDLYNEAIFDYSAAIAKAPTRAQLYSSRAYAYSKLRPSAGLNRTREELDKLAIADCKHALELDKDATYAKQLLDWYSRNNIGQ